MINALIRAGLWIIQQIFRHARQRSDLPGGYAGLITEHARRTSELSTDDWARSMIAYDEQLRREGHGPR
jgi:hypothetical protein